MNSSDLPIIILGTGGHAKVVADTLLCCGQRIQGFIDPVAQFSAWCEIPYLGNDDILSGVPPSTVRLVNGIGSVPFSDTRFTVAAKAESLGFVFCQVIHPSAVIAADTKLAAGVQILAGAIIQTGSIIGKHSIVNTAARIDHDCRIAEFCHIAPGATLCGSVQLAQRVHIGAGATIIQEIDVGADTVIGAGTTITKSIDSMQVVRSPEVVTEARRR
tara:strand:- start:1563 stop:2210 length:648 start_codon:yes stop_codon:yes gene_type:complete